MLQDHTADWKSFIFWNISPLFVVKSNYEVFEKVHQLYAWVVIVIDEAVGLVDCKAAHIQTLSERTLSKVKKNALSNLQTRRWKVSMIWSYVNSWKCNTKEIIISPKQDLPCIKINKSTNDITYSPSLSKVLMLNIPFLDSVAIEGIRVRTIANAILCVEIRVALTPTDLHEAIG